MYPAYVYSGEAELVEYKINVHFNGDPYVILTHEENGLSLRPIGSYIQRDTLINEVEVIQNFLKWGLTVDTTQGSAIKQITSNPEHNVFDLYFKVPDVDIKFISEHCFVGHESENVVDTIQTPYLKLSVLTPVDTDSDGVVFVGWRPELPDDELVPRVSAEYEAIYLPDTNNDGVADANQITVTFKINEPGITFKADKYPSTNKSVVLNAEGTVLTYWLTMGESEYPEAPDKDDLNIPADKKLALAAWEDANGQEYALSGAVDADAVKADYTAQFGKDEDGDGVVDPDDPENPDDPGQGGDTPGGDTPGGNTPGGGDHGGTTGPTPVSVSNSGNPEDLHYTVGVNGQWVHMDNVDINVPLDEPMPVDATAMGSPEWHRWRFYLANGLMLYNQWGYIENPYAVEGQPRSGWFYFDHDGLMRYGWYLDARSGDWYYMHSESDGMLGTMITGWHYDTHDGKWYYLDPATGAMKTGWQQIDGKWYYFNPTPVAETWSYDSAVSVWRFNGNTVRPYGSMYQNEMTPDGYYVDANGVWVQ